MNGTVDMSALTQDTLDRLKAAIDVRKAITTANGLVGYDLRAPAIDLKPVLCPVVNMLPRTPAVIGSNSSNWKAVTAISPSASSPFLAEGAAGGDMVYSVADRSAAYKTWGRKDSVSEEAEWAALGFEDLRARSNFWLLNIVKLEEEDSFMGGNTSQALGTTPTPTLTVAGSSGTLPALTYSVICVALPYFGYQRATRSGVLALLVGVGGTYAQKSAAATQAVTLGQILSCKVAAVRGAFAYAWYIGAAGAEKLEAITAINSITFSAPLAGTGQAASALGSSDNSTDSLAFDGMLTQLWTPGSGATVIVQPDGTPGTGTALTSDSAGGIKEIDAVLKALWDTARVSPDTILLNSQQAGDIYVKILSGSNARSILELGSSEQGALTGSGAVARYLNKYTSGAVQFQVHPTIPPGTMFFLTQRLPAWYPGNRAPGAFDVHVLQDYHEIPYAMTDRNWNHGVYVRGVLRSFLPTAQGILTNIAAG